MVFLKEHKVKLIITSLVLILFIFTLLGIKELFYPDNKKSYYGNRLEGIENHNINQTKLKKLSEQAENAKGIVKISSNIKGRVINFNIQVDETVDLISAQSLGQQMLESFSEDERGYFDFQLFIDSEETENEIYPIFGYKHKTSTIFKWSK